MQFTARRGARPWIGTTVETEEVEVPADNALAPLGRRVQGTTPDYRGVFTFTNDLPVFSTADAPEPSVGDDLYRTRRATGSAEVVCYHHDPTRTMADLDDDEVAAVVQEWRDRTAALQALDGVAHVLVFENRGAAVGTSNPHPHCQIYAGSLVYATMAREAEVAASHHGETGRAILADVVERELTGPRVISEGETIFACVPWFARWAYEVHVLPRVPVTSLVDLDDDGCRSLALVLRDVVRRYDALWGARTVFDDEYLASGGQIHEPLTGRDRFCADLRPLVDPAAFAAHPYDLCTALVLEEAGGVVTDPWGGPLDAPLDTTSPVAWVGYANPHLAERIGPALGAILHARLGAQHGH